MRTFRREHGFSLHRGRHTECACCFSIAALALAWTFSTASAAAVEDPDSRAVATGILRETGIQGGLVVHVGCGDGKLTAALRAGDGYLVHGLDTDAANVAKARQNIRKTGLYGKVAVDQLEGERLPYVDNLVNLLVAEDLGRVPQEEVVRVLAPGGTAYVKSGGRWAKTVKPRPEDIDEWTHYFHGPDNNGVAEDSRVGPPRHMQWLAGPKWTRHHHADKGSNPTIRAVVSAKGRIFYMVDEATAANIAVPSRWVLAARDAASGVLLWKQPLKVGKFERRLERVWRTLIAGGNRVYAPLGTGEPLSSLDAATGKIIRNCSGTEGVEEVIIDDGHLFAVNGRKQVVAIRADTGELLWQWEPEKDAAIVPLTLAAADGKVLFKTDKDIRCLAAKTGKELWRFTPEIDGPRKRLNWPRARLVVNDGVVLCSYGGQDPAILNRDKWDYLGSHPPVKDYGGILAALSADDGRVLWKTAYRPGLESFPGMIYVIDGLVWCGPDFAQGLDLRTGEVKRENPVIEKLWTLGHHNRCYPGKATGRYILTSKRGIEMIDLKGENHSRNNWVRGTCRVGVLPCNGLIYAPPHSCGCYMEAKLYGFWALAGKAESRKQKAEEGSRLQRGPAYDDASSQLSAFRSQLSADWPTYRHDPMRSGSTPAEVPSGLKLLWEADIGGRLSAITVADGKVFVAQVDAHTVCALNAAGGKVLWKLTAGGRVDSPPTFYRGLVLFGSRDGWVYCLRASDGQLAWRFLAAPQKINAVAFDQVESLWPVHGSVLVKDGIAYAAAGRSSHLDGGIMLYGLEPATGKVLCKTRVETGHATATPPPPEEERLKMEAKFSQNGTDYKTFTAPDRSDAFSMSGARTDVLVAGGESVFMQHVRFDGKLVEQEDKLPHLFSTSSLLDGAENHRSHWVLGTGDFSRTPIAYSWIAHSGRKNNKSLAVPYGLMMVLGDKTVWGVQRSHLIRLKKEKGKKGKYALFARERADLGAEEKSLPDFRNPVGEFKWMVDLPMRPRAMLRAGEVLFVGGMPDRIDRSDPSAPCNAEFEGEKGGLLRVVSCGDGKTLSERRLDAPPVWDGMAAGDGRLYLSLRNGRILCFGR